MYNIYIFIYIIYNILSIYDIKKSSDGTKITSLQTMLSSFISNKC